jgi:AcrR family transcriptional regulator
MNDATPPPPRKLPRDARRLQLIEATIDTIATRGYARTTLTEVARLAGLSHGLVNFHFQTKEKLLGETLEYLAEEYRQNWLAALDAAPKDPASQLDALLRADFHPTVCTPARLSAWCAFWGEAQSRPLYQDHCAANDADYIRVMESVCTALHATNPIHTARVLRLTIEGVWLDLMTMLDPYGHAEALCTVYSCAAAYFPAHFTPEGLR